MKNLVLLFFVCISHLVISQNLVPNPSFEEYTTCPVFINDFGKLINWNNPSNGSPNYFNICSNGNVGVPNNNFGYQNPFSGNGYIGLCLHTESIENYREYAQIELSEPLVANIKYYVSYYVSLADSFNSATSEICALLTDNSFYFDTNINLNFNPQITNSVVITDKINWMKISSSYLANGGEKFLTIGNFKNDSNTQIVIIGTTIGAYFGTYYFLDDVYVGLDSTVNINTEAPSKKEEITLYPNPANENVFIKTENSKPAEMFVYNMQGCLMHQQRFLKRTNIDIKNWPAGVYYVKIVTEKGIFVRKVVREE
ncbi:MAG TPA: hypothetical protein DEH02_08655 [Bacteroidales bacterium]|nr:MAG: hypothetical protein A2X01_03385 [Bacteroidetes bacterium GWF2_35_48]HBX51120.1 hypothetical protein [Bacteroidales bacterium]